MAKADAPQALDTAEFLQRLNVLRADAVDKNLVQFAGLVRGRHRKGENVPEGEAEIIHQHLAPCLRLPGGRVDGSEQLVEVTGAGGKVDFASKYFNKPVNLLPVQLH